MFIRRLCGGFIRRPKHHYLAVHSTNPNPEIAANAFFLDISNSFTIQKI
jgi:hypothetical protein